MAGEPSTPISKRASNEKASEGEKHFKPDEETQAEKVVDPNVGKARVVQGRGRGRQARKGFGRLGGR